MRTVKIRNKRTNEDRIMDTKEIIIEKKSIVVKIEEKKKVSRNVSKLEVNEAIA